MMSSQVQLLRISLALFVLVVASHLTWGQEVCPTAPRSQYPGCVCLVPVFKLDSGLRSPIAMLQPDDGTGRFFVAEQIGVVRVTDERKRHHEFRKEPFLDLRSKVLTSDRAGDERGLLGMAFHPRFKDNGYLYVYYSTREGGGNRSVVARFNVSDNENKVDRRYERVLLEIDQPGDRNYGGQLLFGLDGFLYISVGDGGGGATAAADRSSLLGKILRIDVDRSDSARPYGIPDDNPFVGDTDRDTTEERPEVFAFGFRNPRQCSLDPGDGARRERIFCGDVGDSNHEVNILSRGRNYGQGLACVNPDECNEDDVLSLDVYSRTEGSPVIGGVMYRGCSLPDLRGLYLYADHLGLMKKRLFYLEEQPDGPWVNETICVLDNAMCKNRYSRQSDRTVDHREHFILGFGQDLSGELYLLTSTSRVVSQPTGQIFRLVDPGYTGGTTSLLPTAFLLVLTALVIARGFPV